MKKLLSLILILILCAGFTARADEGMWLLPLLEKKNIGTMTQMGLKLSAEDIYSLNKACLKDAVVIFGGGCTGEIVSSQGLILTNHHCGYGSIQAHSTVGHDYLKDGFWAKTKQEELPNPNLSVTFLVRIEDVTDKILEGVKDGMSEADRTAAISDARQKVEKEASEGNNYKNSVASFYGGNFYYLLVYVRYNDVRLVGAPPFINRQIRFRHRQLGNGPVIPGISVFSGSIPRQTENRLLCKENVPLKPKNYLKVSLRDLQPGDFTMILGYPGRTSRYMTSYEVNEQLILYIPTG